MLRFLLGCSLALSIAACSSKSEPDRTTVVIRGDRVVTLTVEVADSPEERERGLMSRPALDPDAGMLFLFDRPSTTAFVMRDTTIPLSIAFYDGVGAITQILDMDPCGAEPCRLYRPRAPYVGALEVSQGAFRRFGVREGDRLEVSGNG